MMIERLSVARECASFVSVFGVSCYVARFDALQSVIQSAEQLLSESELEKQAGYAYAEDRTRYGLSHAFLRLLLAQALFPEASGQMLRMKAQDVRLATTPFGKPILDQSMNLNLTFSLSRSRHETAIGLGRNVALGVDVESLEQRDHMTPALLEYAFSPVERRQLADSDSPEEDALKLWTRKEAILKADGRGLRLAPLDIVTTLTDGVPTALPEVLGDLCAWGVFTESSGTEVFSVARRRW